MSYVADFVETSCLTDWRLVFTDWQGDAYDLTGKEVELHYRIAGGEEQIRGQDDGVAVQTPATAGIAVYTVQEGDLTGTGEMRMRCKIIDTVSGKWSWSGLRILKVEDDAV